MRNLFKLKKENGPIKDKIISKLENTCKYKCKLENTCNKLLISLKKTNKQTNKRTAGYKE